MKISEGNRVGVLLNGEIKKGVVKSVYSDLDYAIVKFEDGVSKVMLHNIGLLPEEKYRDTEEPKPDPEESKKPVEKSEITITPAEFEKIGSKVCGKLATKIGPSVILLGATILAGLHTALFIEGEND